MWRLRARPDGQLAVELILGNHGMVFHGSMRVALEEEFVLADMVRFRESNFGRLELEVNLLMDVPLAPLVFMDSRFLRIEGLVDAHDCRQGLVQHLDRITGLL